MWLVQISRKFVLLSEGSECHCKFSIAIGAIEEKTRWCADPTESFFALLQTTNTHIAGARNTGWNSKKRKRFSRETIEEEIAGRRSIVARACLPAGTFFPPFFLALRKKGETLAPDKEKANLWKIKAMSLMNYFHPFTFNASFAAACSARCLLLPVPCATSSAPMKTADVNFLS